jgi:hypothetical protein
MVTVKSETLGMFLAEDNISETCSSVLGFALLYALGSVAYTARCGLQ